MTWVPHSKTLACARAQRPGSTLFASLLPNDCVCCQGARSPHWPAGREVQCGARGWRDFNSIAGLPKEQADLQQVAHA